MISDRSSNLVTKAIEVRGDNKVIDPNSDLARTNKYWL
jgi:hypothetical protein